MATLARQDLTGVRLKAKNGAWLVHPDLRARMIAEAHEHSTNLTDLATKILSERYGVAYEPNVRRSSPAVGSEDQMNFRFSDELKRAIIVGAAPTGMVQAIRVALCEHYNLPMP